jgi:hypothetical protein
MDGQIMLAIKAYQIMLIAFVITHEDILAMHTAIIFPPTLSLLNGFTLRMVVALKWYLMIF